MDFRVFSRNISENMHARCVREDTKEALKENLQADGVQSRQTLFVWYCLKSIICMIMLQIKEILLCQINRNVSVTPACLLLNG